MQPHYVEIGPLNVLAAAPRKRIGRARKRLLDSSKLRFSDLKPLMEARATQSGGISASSLPNLNSALRGFLDERGFSDASPVGSVMRASYYSHVRAHAAALRAQGRPTTYISNRRSALKQWRRCVLDYDRHCAVNLQQATPFRAAIAELLGSCASQRSLAKASNIPLSTLKRWASGCEPNRRSLQHVPHLERIAGLAAGALSDLLATRPKLDAVKAPAAIDYRQRLRVQQRLHYALKNPSERLRREWADYVKYKVSQLDNDAGVPLERSRRGRWSSSASSNVKQTASNWACFYRGRYVPTAGLSWTHVSQFLGWLILGQGHGGQGMPLEEAASLANFANRALLHEYVEWRQERAGGVFHSGIKGFVMLASSLCHPRTGYLTQSWARFASSTSAPTEAEWLARCDVTFKSLKFLRDRLKDDSGKSRDSFQPIKDVLALPNPLDAIADMVMRMNANRHTSGGKQEAIDARDILMVKLLASNPVRDKNFRLMTYREDGTGNLRRDATGAWSLHVPSRELKNFQSSVGEQDYDMPIRPEVWPDIERYIHDYRPMLLKEPSDVVFISVSGRPFSICGLRRRFEQLTRLYLQGCPGVGPHAMRHIVATSLLKANPNDWASAAWALHDREETVRKHYAHLKSRDVERWFGKAMDGPFGRM